MIVKILSYDQVKGKGVYQTPHGSTHVFTYRDFADQKMIPAREQAEVFGGILYPLARMAWYVRLWLKIKEVMKWR